MSIPQFPGLGPVLDRYDALILDLWGVVHNGVEPYPGVPECLDALAAAGKKVCLLTNAPRRPAGVERRLKEMGLGPERYQHVMTSGEATFEALQDRDMEWVARLGRRFVFMGPERDHDVYEGLDYTRVEEPENADFIINCGIVDYGMTVEDYAPLLGRCLAAGLPMICANPDIIVVVGDRMEICAGTLAAYYADQGGEVLLFGKPYPPVYERCFHLLGIGADRSRVLAVGDGLRTDIAGANAVGIDSALVIGGIHMEEVAAAWGGLADPAKLDRLVAEIGPKPTFAIPSLRL
jgi:HAD superfamily hydrolase (TIGR01459 family)